MANPTPIPRIQQGAERPQEHVRDAFGAASVQCAVLATELRLADCVAPEVLHGRTRNRGRVLFASRGHNRQVLVVTRAPLRLQVRGDQASVSLLELTMAPLLRSLHKRLPGSQLLGLELTIPIEVPTPDPAALDRDVLREPSLLDPVRALVALVGDREPCAVPVGVFGAFAFDLVDHFESLGPRRPDPGDDADLELVLGLDIVRYDEDHHSVQVVTRGLPWEAMSVVQERHAKTLKALREPDQRAPGRTVAGQCGPRIVEQPDQQFLDGVHKLREHIAAGDVFQAVLSRAVQWQCNADSLDVFELLTAREPSPYSFHLDLEHGALFGASPETCVRVDDRQVEIRPIAGTTERSSDSDTDARLALALLFDHKERAEHVMLLDLARNDIARIAVPGTTEVVQQFAVEKYSRVQHLVSRVRGTLRPELDALHAYRAAANMGTLSGAPKARATELIREIEPTGRGFYGGAVGYLMADGSFDSCITIRSMRAKNGVYRAQAGAGIVWHSDADRELEETDRKLRAVGEVMASLQGVPSVEVRA